VMTTASMSAASQVMTTAGSEAFCGSCKTRWAGFA
jgi:hypothetical protein